jgi:hypothetical protein
MHFYNLWSCTIYIFTPNTITGAEFETLQLPKCNIDKGVVLTMPTLPVAPSIVILVNALVLNFIFPPVVLLIFVDIPIS